ncbi:type VI secretion system Vgr family protein [Pedobacter steynii]|uniref:Gp5/Type VI secretion system Vgr protein OB-fold domain-containing protein n=1 Tax=Pedobacter steynii TaxID=430522 RepID=A0A1D7QKH9_9SPHI|nr:phage baseplate assembly protein V [Pedobacter steynii]AOM79181.1 hypothetical protein BFS30_19610 [Pedobacter steynii]
MENKVTVEINIEGVPVVTFSSLNLYQRFNEHHTFELRFNQDQVELPGALSLKKSKEFVGKSIAIEFGKDAFATNRFSGIITKVEISQTHGLMGDIIVSGYSPTILIDRGPDLGSYLEKNLKSIIDQATKEVAANDLPMLVNPSRKAPIDYVIQYRESDFDFLNRLSAQYHEWFYYDGTQVVFGKPDEMKEVKLVYGRDLSNIQYGIEIAPLRYKKFAYNPKEDELLSADGKGQSSGSPDMMHAIAASNTVYSKSYHQPLITRADSKADIDGFVENEQKSMMSGLLNINCTGDHPEVGIGRIVDISMSTRNLNEFAIEDFGKFLVTSIYHHIDGVGHYQNSFGAISADTERVPGAAVQNPQPDMQLANVVDNNDPSGHGRIKVKFKWECGCNDVTEWLRVITPDAGSSDQVSKNRGFVFIPEVGDQVVIAFEEGNIARPIVMGSVFHGKSGTGGDSANKTKALTTRSGNTIIMDDSNGSVNVKDPSGNVITMHGDGNVSLTAPNSFTINTKDFIVNAGNSIALNAQPGEQGGGEGTVNISAKKTIAATADTEGITLDATTLGVAITGKTDVSIESTDAIVSLTGKTETLIDGADIKMSGGSTIRINSDDTDIT